jgi:hypothetical protein
VTTWWSRNELKAESLKLKAEALEVLEALEGLEALEVLVNSEYPECLEKL